MRLGLQPRARCSYLKYSVRCSGAPEHRTAGPETIGHGHADHRWPVGGETANSIQLPHVSCGRSKDKKYQLNPPFAQGDARLGRRAVILCLLELPQSRESPGQPMVTDARETAGDLREAPGLVTNASYTPPTSIMDGSAKAIADSGLPKVPEGAVATDAAGPDARADPGSPTEAPTVARRTAAMPTPAEFQSDLRVVRLGTWRSEDSDPVSGTRRLPSARWPRARNGSSRDVDRFSVTDVGEGDVHRARLRRVGAVHGDRDGRCLRAADS